jgi:hypothetical protein
MHSDKCGYVLIACCEKLIQRLLLCLAEGLNRKIASILGFFDVTENTSSV